MMNENNSRDGFMGNPKVLGDITNCYGEREFSGKKGISLVLGDFVMENETKFAENVGSKDEDDEFSHRVCRKVDNFVKGKENAIRVSKESENVTDSNSNVLSLLNANEIVDGDLHFIKDSCISSVSPKLGECQGGSRKVGVNIERNAIWVDNVFDPLVTDAYGSGLQFMDSQESKVDGSENFTEEALNKYSIGQSRMSGSLGCKMFNLEGDVEAHASLNGEGGFNTNDSLNLDKASSCECSFCLKAAYLWSDLHYQDAHGRLAAFETSRKKVKLLLGRSYDQDNNVTIACKKSTKLELDLMHKWRSLFLHTDDALARESAELQSNLHRLKELRGTCKKDLEMNQGATSGKS
ncbi:uncharacterized protein LOC143889574 [Tasmannia lanceolata]|uniref:uncharacterized protein LOC143889574 n=1 Tax=Tasmannia lanceolata TaxID=3420 RepID=UPI004062DC86